MNEHALSAFILQVSLVTKLGRIITIVSILKAIESLKAVEYKNYVRAHFITTEVQRSINGVKRE